MLLLLWLLSVPLRRPRSQPGWAARGAPMPNWRQDPTAGALLISPLASASAPAARRSRPVAPRLETVLALAARSSPPRSTTPAGSCRTCVFLCVLLCICPLGRRVHHRCGRAVGRNGRTSPGAFGLCCQLLELALEGLQCFLSYFIFLDRLCVHAPLGVLHQCSQAVPVFSAARQVLRRAPKNVLWEAGWLPHFRFCRGNAPGGRPLRRFGRMAARPLRLHAAERQDLFRPIGAR